MKRLAILVTVALAATSALGAETPARQYARGVQAAGLQAVADLEYAPPGPASPPRKVPGRDAWPACVTPGAPSPNQLTIDPTNCGKVVLQGWKLAGWDIRVIGRGEVLIADNEWTPKAGSKSYMLGVGYFDGAFGGAPSVTVERNLIDGTGQGPNGVFAIFGSGKLFLKSDTIRNFGPQVLTTIGEHNDRRERSLSVIGCWLGPIGANSFNGVASDPSKYWNGAADREDPKKPGGAHAEVFKLNFGGSVDISGNLIDLYGNPGDRGAGFSSLISAEGFEGVVTGRISGNVLRWSRKGQRWSAAYVPRAPFYTLYFYSAPGAGAWGAFSYDLAVTGNVIQKGVASWVSRDDRPGAPATRISASRNFDHDSGAALNDKLFGKQ